MRRMTRGVVALEEEIVAAAAAAPEVAAIGDNAESLETDLIEVTEEAAAQSDEAAQTEEAGEVVEALESIAEAMKLSAANGGLDKHAAHAIGIATEHMYQRVGLKTSSMPALESFGGTSSRVGATKLAMEDIKEQAKKIWAAIVAAFKRAIQWAIDFYNKIFGAWEKLEKRADALATKADGVTGTAKEKTFENERLAGALNIGGTVPANVMEHVKSLQELCATLSNADRLKLYEVTLESMSATDAEKEFAKKYALPAFSAGGIDGSALSNPESLGFNPPKAGLSIYRSKELLGGKALITRANSKALVGEEAITAFSGFNAGVEAFDPKAKELSKKDLPVLTTAAAEEIAKAVSKVSVEGRAYRNKLGKTTEMKKKMTALAEKMAKDAGSAEGEAVENFKAMQKVASNFARTIDQPAGSVSVYALGTSKALLDYVEESLKQYGKADK